MFRNMKAAKHVVEILVEEFLTKNTYEMTFDESQDFIGKSIEVLKTEYIVRHLRKHQTKGK